MWKWAIIICLIVLNLWSIYWLLFTSARSLLRSIMRGLQVSGSGSQVKVDVPKRSSHKAPSPGGGRRLLVAFATIPFRGAVFQWHGSVSEPDSSLPSQTVFLGGPGGKRIFWTFVSITWVLPQWAMFHWAEDVLLIVYVQLIPFEKTILEVKNFLVFSTMLLFVFWNISLVRPYLARIS